MNPAADSRVVRAMRRRGMFRKEALQIVRDPSSIAIAFVMPIVLLLIFGYGITLDARDVPVGIVVERPTPRALDFASSFERSEYFRPARFADVREAEAALRAGRLRGIVWVRAGFDAGAHGGGGGGAAAMVDGVDANTARILMGYVQGAWASWRAREAAARGAAAALPPVRVESRIWYNPELRSRNYLVPGLIAVIMTLTGALLTALVVSREWERGTMESLLATPVSIRELVAGKLLPYFGLGMGGMVFTVAVALVLFGVPLRGSPLALAAAAALFLGVALTMGLLISAVARNQFVAGQVAILATFLPAFLLSGFIFDIGSMPRPIQALTHVVAARYFVAMVQSTFLAGTVWPVLGPNALALAGLGLVFLALVRRHLRKSLE